MKYILKFNESMLSRYNLYNTPYKDIKKFCNDHLAFIVDEGFKIEIGKPSYNDYKIFIEISKSVKGEFNYNDIKDDFIPFLEEFVRVYDINTGVPQETIDYHNSTPEAKFKKRSINGDGYGTTHRTDLPKICIVEFTYKGHVKSTYSLQHIIDDSVKSILHKDQEYPINVGVIHSIIIKL